MPGPFNPTPDATNPWGTADAGDQCGDLAFTVTNSERTFTNLPIICQDNDSDGFADLQILLTWDHLASTACGTDTGQTFPTDGGTRSKCDFQIQNTVIIISDPIVDLVLD